jgi:hypothetical protein
MSLVGGGGWIVDGMCWVCGSGSLLILLLCLLSSSCRGPRSRGDVIHGVRCVICTVPKYHTKQLRFFST